MEFGLVVQVLAVVLLDVLLFDVAHRFADAPIVEAFFLEALIE